MLLTEGPDRARIAKDDLTTPRQQIPKQGYHDCFHNISLPLWFTSTFTQAGELISMTIPNDTLDRWSGYENAAINTAKAAHTHVQETLNSDDGLSDHSFITLNTILQGSYANQTIVRGSGDVDILAINEEIFESNNTELTNQEQDAFWNDFTEVSYRCEDYRGDILEVLRDGYGTLGVTDGPKAIELNSDYATGIELDADVVPVLRYREYETYPGDPTEGIAFKTDKEDWIINFPEQHKKAATRIHGETNDRYKPTVRMFKRARNELVEKSNFEKEIAPSYFIECLLSNASQGAIEKYDLQDRFAGVLNNLIDNAEEWQSFTAQHGLRDLFGDRPEQWNTEDAVEFVTALTDLWENWEDY